MNQNAEQISIFDLDSPSGRTSMEHSAPERRKAKTSESSLRNSAGSQTPRYQFLDLRTASGNRQERSWVTGGQSHGVHMTRNTGELPNVVVESRLSQILEPLTPENSYLKEYWLSGTACNGIIRRAEGRGKQLPKILREALESMIELDASPSKSELESPVVVKEF